MTRNREVKVFPKAGHRPGPRLNARLETRRPLFGRRHIGGISGPGLFPEASPETILARGIEVG